MLLKDALNFSNSLNCLLCVITLTVHFAILTGIDDKQRL